MMFITAILASFVLGAGVTALVLSTRWKQAVAEARDALDGMAEKYRAHEQENRELKQKNADLEYQVGTLTKDLNYERNRQK
jgi:cell division protein FtsB